MIRGQSPVRHQTPVLHSPRSEVGQGDHVHLWEREGQVEVILKVTQDPRADVPGVVRLFDGLLSRPHCGGGWGGVEGGGWRGEGEEREFMVKILWNSVECC